MTGAANSLNLNCKVRVMQEVPGASVSVGMADIFSQLYIGLFHMLLYKRDTYCALTDTSFDK